MNDVLFISFAKDVIEYVDEKYGRAAAWLAFAGILLILVALTAALIWWLAR